MSTTTSEHSRGFFVGETIVLVVKTSVWRTKAPLAMDEVEVSLLQHEGEPVVIADPAFAEIEGGDYRFVLDTEGFDPGRYRLVVRTSKADTGIVMLEDAFVLREA